MGVLQVEAARALAGKLGGEGRVHHRVATLLSRLHHQAGQQPKQLNLELGEKILYILYSNPVLRIHDILVWIRIRGSMPLTNGSGSFYFRH